MALAWAFTVERVTGIEPALSAGKLLPHSSRLLQVAAGGCPRASVTELTMVITWCARRDVLPRLAQQPSGGISLWCERPGREPGRVAGQLCAVRSLSPA